MKFNDKYVADLETTTTPEDLRAWACCMVSLETCEPVFTENNLDSLFEYLKNKNSTVYFHNLKFDGEFIISWLFNHGFLYSDDPAPNTFNSLITDNGLFYSITVYFSIKNRKYKKVTFLDSLKKLPFKVSNISKAFDIPEKKLHINYTEERAINHRLTQLEKEYVEADAIIVAKALRIQLEQGLTRMTNASDALHNFKSIIGVRQFERLFPVLPFDLDEDIRRAYKGGYTYLNPIHKNKRIKGGVTLDVNSLYPWAMYTCLLPWGYPMYFEGEPVHDENYPLYIVRIRCEFELKKNHLPTIQLKNNRAFVETEYLSSSNGEIVELTLTNVDLQLFLEHYETYNLEYVNGWKFKGKVGIFKEYIDYWMRIKETTTGALRQLAKLMLNSLYGKFATNPKASRKTPYMDDNSVVKYRVDNGELRDPVYTAMAAFITAYAREKTIRSGQKLYKRFIYCDTDSLHLVGRELPEDLEIHATRLGAWKHEGTFLDSKYIRAKTYLETMETDTKDTLENYCKALNKTFEVWREAAGIHWHKLIVTCAGMPDNVKELVDYDNFQTGSVFPGKLTPKRYPGGVVLTETNFTIR